MQIRSELLNILTRGEGVVIGEMSMRLNGPVLTVVDPGGKEQFEIIDCIKNIQGLSYQSKIYLVENCSQPKVVKLFDLPQFTSKQELYFACCAT